MRDNTLYQSDAAVAADAFAGSMDLGKSPASGVWLMFTILRNDSDADETLKINVHAKDADSGWATTDEKCTPEISIVNADVANGATIVRYALLQTDKRYINPHYDVGGTTPSWTITCAVSSGPDQGKTA